MMFIDMHGNLWMIHEYIRENLVKAEVIVAANGNSFCDVDGINHTSWRSAGWKPQDVFVYLKDVFICPD